MRNHLLLLLLVAAPWCVSAQGQDSQAYALQGTLVTPTTVISNGTIVVSGGKIAGIGTVVDVPSGVTPLDTESYIFPGLIDLHNHLTWNLFPRWPPSNWKPKDWDTSKKFRTRYDWQQLQSYKDDLDSPHRLLFDEGWGCEMNRFGEVKALAGGATSSLGSLGPEKCIEGLVRDLDFYSGLYKSDDFKSEKLVNNVFPLEMSVDAATSLRSNLTSGQITAFVIHLAEGAGTLPCDPEQKSSGNGDASTAREYKMFVAQGFLRPGVSVIHGVGLKSPQFQEMAAHSVGLIWSPRSNCELYGTTTDIASAKNAGVILAIAPDWSPSGSSGMIEELKYVAAWNARQHPKIFDDADLVKMATIYPAQLAGLSDKIGSLTRGNFADLLLLRRKGTDPYAALVHATPLDIRLVVVGGNPLFGDRELMERFVPPNALESLSLCGKADAKVLYLGPSASGQPLKQTWNDTTVELSRALQQWNIKLADLTEASECTN